MAAQSMLQDYPVKGVLDLKNRRESSYDEIQPRSTKIPIKQHVSNSNFTPSKRYEESSREKPKVT